MLTTADPYETLAPAYDLLTADYDYDRWLDQLLAWAETHDLRFGRVLDVACGTGKSFEPLERRGWQVAACDRSPAMLEVAATRGPEALHCLDMRSLPRLGSFELVTCLDDSINHLLSAADVASSLRGMARNLAPHGLLVFDVNTLAAYRSLWARDEVTDVAGHVVAWRGLCAADETVAGSVGEVQVDVFASVGEGLWTRSVTVHQERHYSVDEIFELLAEAELEVVDVRGQLPGVVLEPGIDEHRHTKALFLARPRRCS